MTRLTFLAGSSSRLFTLSGILSEDIAAIGGRSGSVVIAPSFGSLWLVSACERSESSHDLLFDRSTPFRV
jgi:hypothetical protein